MGRYHAANSSEEFHHLTSFSHGGDACCLHVMILLFIIGLICGLAGAASDDSGQAMPLMIFGFSLAVSMILVLLMFWMFSTYDQYSLVIDKSSNLVYFVTTDILFCNMNFTVYLKKELIGPLNRVLCATHSRTVVNYVSFETGKPAGSGEINKIFIHFNNQNIQTVVDHIPPFKLPIKGNHGHNEFRNAIMHLNQLFHKYNNANSETQTLVNNAV